VEPQPGHYNEAAIARYVEMARKLKAAGIEPVVTLWHFTFPDWMVTKGDPRHISATWPPGILANFGMHAAAMREAVWGFREAAKIVKENRKDALIMSVEAMPYWYWTFWDPTRAYFNFMQRINYTHLDRTYDVCDLIGFNYYYTEYADFTAIIALKARRGRNYSLLGWVIQPRNLYHQIQNISHRYGKPIVITENGIATSKDIKRVRYLFNHMLEVKEALQDGYDVRGYFVWTLVDNYEWHHGYKAPFGLSRMDPVTKRRLLRPSALFYKGIIGTSEASSMLDEVSSAPELPPGLIER
jgi:beta-glucosidase